MGFVSGKHRVRIWETPGGQFALGGRLFEAVEAEAAAELGGESVVRRRRYCINYVVEGSGTYEDDEGMVYRIGPHTIFHRLPGRWHKTTIDSKRYVECFFHFSGSLYQVLRSAGTVADSPAVTPVDDPEGAARAAPALYETLLPQWAGGWNEVVARLVGLLGLRRKEAPADTAPAWVGRIRKWLIRNADRRITVSEMAERTGMPADTFSRRFKEHVGCPPGHFLIRRRIDRACNLLRTHTVKTVAYELNYPDPKTFSKQFHRYVGMPPSEFQRQELGR
jgi:AraC-like DNA-binding protein